MLWNNKSANRCRSYKHRHKDIGTVSNDTVLHDQLMYSNDLRSGSVNLTTSDMQNILSIASPLKEMSSWDSLQKFLPYNFRSGQKRKTNRTHEPHIFWQVQDFICIMFQEGNFMGFWLFNLILLSCLRGSFPFCGIP